MSAPLSAADGAWLLALARAAIEERLLGGDVLIALRARITLTETLAALRACFVTLEADGMLRGCIGSTEALRPAHEAVVEAARLAAFEDPRFTPVSADELPAIRLSVSALTPMVAVASAESIVPGFHGVALDALGRKALFLPEVAAREGWTRDELLARLARKAGLPAEAWRLGTLRVFSCQRFTESLGGLC